MCPRPLFGSIFTQTPGFHEQAHGHCSRAEVIDHRSFHLRLHDFGSMTSGVHLSRIWTQTCSFFDLFRLTGISSVCLDYKSVGGCHLKSPEPHFYTPHFSPPDSEDRGTASLSQALETLLLGENLTQLDDTITNKWKQFEIQIAFIISELGKEKEWREKVLERNISKYEQMFLLGSRTVGNIFNCLLAALCTFQNFLPWPRIFDHQGKENGVKC